MRVKSNISALLAATVIGLVASAAQAGPAGGASGLGNMADKSVTQVDYRKCWWRSGERVCRWYTDDGEPRGAYRGSRAYVDVGSRRPEEFATGSSEWWRAMDRQGRGGFGRN